MIDLVRYLGYFFLLVIAIIVVIKQSKSPRCDQCQAKLGKKGVTRYVYGEEQLLCMDCNDTMRANENIPDLNELIP